MKRLAIVAFSFFVALALCAAVATRFKAGRIADRFPADGRFVAVEGGRLHYTDSGGGDAGAPPLLMIHGASSNHSELPLALSQTLNGRYRVISIDRPGHGWSDRIGGRDAASPARQAALIAQAMDKIGAPRAIIVAHSMAGVAALNLALDHQEKVAGLVLISPVSHPWPGGIAWYYSLTADPWVGSLFANTLALPLGLVGMKGGVISTFAPQRAPENYVERARIPLVLRPANFEANAQDVAALKAFVAIQSKRYGEIAAPVAIVSGDRDETVSTDIHSRALLAQIVGAELTVLPGVGHAPHHFAPDVVVAAIDSVAGRSGRSLAAR